MCDTEKYTTLSMLLEASCNLRQYCKYVIVIVGPYHCQYITSFKNDVRNFDV